MTVEEATGIINHVSYFSFYFIFSLTILNWRQFFRMAFVRKGLFRGVSKSEIMCAMRRIALSSSMLDSTCTCLLTLFRSCELLKVVLIFSLEHLLRGLWGLLLKYWYPLLERWWFAFNFVRFLDDLIYKTINVPVNVNAATPNPGKGGDLDKRTRKDEQCPHPQKNIPIPMSLLVPAYQWRYILRF